MRTSTFPLYDRAAGGRLKVRLRTMRRRGMTFEQIAEKLRTEGINVSTSTVHRWCHQQGVEQLLAPKTGERAS